MAKGTESVNASDLWAQSAARVGYAVHNGAPLIGVSGDEGDGHLIPLPTPTYFGSIEDEGTRDNVFRAVAAHALRVAQSALKTADSPSRQHAIDGVASAINGAYKPKRERGNDIVESEVERQFNAHVRGRVLAAKSNATEAEIEATVGKMADSDAGKRWKTEAKDRVLATGTYAVTRKGKGAASGAVDIGDL